LQQIASSLNAFFSWMQTAQSRDGIRYKDMSSLLLAVLSLYQSVFGFGPANFAFATKKPVAPGHHITSLTHRTVYKREDALLDLEHIWMKWHEAVGWLPCLAEDIAIDVLLPAINLVVPFALHASDNVQQRAHVTLSSITSRTGPCGVARVACASLERLADPHLSDSDVPGLMKLIQMLLSVYKNDWTLSVALSSRLLQSRSRCNRNADSISCIDDVWHTAIALSRWIPATAVPRLMPDCISSPAAVLLDASQPSLAATSTTPPLQLQDIVIQTMQSDWPQLHSKYQQRCIALLNEVTSKDSLLSQEHWTFLWQLLPRSVGFGGQKIAKNCFAYERLLAVVEVALNALCPPSSFLPSAFKSLPEFSFPLLDCDGQLLPPALPEDPRLAVVTSLMPLLSDEAYASSFVLAAAAAYEEVKGGGDFKLQLATPQLRTQRIRVFRLCIEVFGVPFFDKLFQPYFSALDGNFPHKYLSPPFFPMHDQEAMDSYMYLSNDIMMSCILGALSLPEAAQNHILRCMMRSTKTLALSTAAMPASYR
jgi:hypothetical protein